MLLKDFRDRVAMPPSAAHLPSRLRKANNACVHRLLHRCVSDALTDHTAARQSDLIIAIESYFAGIGFQAVPAVGGA